MRKLKGASLHSTKVRKLKEEEKMPQMNEKTENLQYNEVAQNWRGAKSEGGLKLEARKLKARNL